LQRKKNSGYTVPTAILLMLLLFAFAVGLLMFAAYNYNNAFQRHEKMQTYLYAKHLMDECEYFIMEGALNEQLANVINDVNADLISKSSAGQDLYGQEYKFKLELEESHTLINSYNDDKIDIDMFIVYKPVKGNVALPAQDHKYVSVGDWIDMEIRIKKIRGNNGEEMEYQFLSEFYCSYDDTLNADGTFKSGLTDADLEAYSKMKWMPFQHTGKIYTE